MLIIMCNFKNSKLIHVAFKEVKVKNSTWHQFCCYKYGNIFKNDSKLNYFTMLWLKKIFFLISQVLGLLVLKMLYKVCLKVSERRKNSIKLPPALPSDSCSNTYRRYLPGGHSGYFLLMHLHISIGTFW